MEHRIYSPLTLRLLMASLSQGRLDELRILCDLFTAGTFFSVPRGWAFESLAHHHIFTQGNNPLVLVPMISNLKTLTKGAASPKNVLIGTRAIEISAPTDAWNTSSLTKYYIPTEGNHPTFDSFIHTADHIVGFQMTVGRRRTLSPIGLQRLVDRAHPGAERWFVFVIPKGQDITIPKSLTEKGLVNSFKYFTHEISCAPIFLGMCFPFFLFLSNRFLR